MELSATLKGFDKALLLFDERKVRRAGSFGINDISKRTRTAADRQVRAKFSLKSPVVREGIRVTERSTARSLQAVITARSAPLSLKHFPTREVADRGGVVAIRSGGRKFDEYRKSSRAQRGLSTKIRKDQGWKQIKRGFALRHSKGGLSFWRRTGRGHWGSMDGAKIIRVISIASMFNQAEVMATINKTIDEHWSRRFKYFLDRELSR